jgi:transcriptional regulator of arginine metabolism
MRAMTTKEERQRAVLELVREHPMQTQQEMVPALQARGIPATQATISRDIADLGLVRTGAGYRVGTPASVVPGLVLSFTQVEFLVVLRSPPGTANMVARAIDESDLEGIAGTVAGDYTTVDVLADRSAAGQLREFLEQK